MDPGHPEDDDLHAGRVLGPYELVAPAGSGGMARVWSARHRATGQLFALKMLMPHLAENEAFREMFFDEAKIASGIHHANVCATFELVELEGLLTLVMEWVDGASLLRVLRAGREAGASVALPYREAVKIVSETSAGLHAAHEAVDEGGRPLSVVHRDVSPHNVLLTRDGRVKVTDFGVAKALGKLHRTIAGQVKGKLAYMSPEQLVGSGVDRRSDVFALGCVLYEITTGERPFKGDHDPQIMTSIIMGKFAPPSALASGYPPSLEEIVVRALATDPDARFATARQLREALEEWLSRSGGPVHREPIARLLQERCLLDADAAVTPARVRTTPTVAGTPDPAPQHEVRLASHQPIERGGSNTLTSLVAVLVGTVLGLGVLFYVREARRARAAAAAADAIPAPEEDAGLTVATIEVGDDGGWSDDGPNDVTLVIGEGTGLFVDGRQLPPGTNRVARPEAGVTTVLVRAEGREDTLVIVEPSSPARIMVTAGPRPEPKAGVP